MIKMVLWNCSVPYWRFLFCRAHIFNRNLFCKWLHWKFHRCSLANHWHLKHRYYIPSLPAAGNFVPKLKPESHVSSGGAGSHQHTQNDKHPTHTRAAPRREGSTEQVPDLTINHGIKSKDTALEPRLFPEENKNTTEPDKWMCQFRRQTKNRLKV